MTPFEERARIQTNVAKLCKAIRERDEDETNRWLANIGADVLVDLNRIANALEDLVAYRHEFGDGKN
jgi:hypothetical protein